MTIICSNLPCFVRSIYLQSFISCILKREEYIIINMDTVRENVQSIYGMTSKVHSLISIVRRCAEDNSVCIPVDKYCNRVAHCPLGSDETDCSCADLDMHECMINGVRLCIFNEWIKSNIMNIAICENEILQFNKSQITKWKYLGKFISICFNQRGSSCVSTISTHQ